MFLHMRLHLRSVLDCPNRSSSHLCWYPTFSAAAMSEMPRTVHVQLRFPLGGAVLDYRADSSVAHRVAVELGRHGVDVSIDENIRDGLADLPNSEQWST